MIVLLHIIMHSYLSLIPSGAEAVEAFLQDWSKDNDWICPPPGIILKAIRYMNHSCASGTLGVHHWPSFLFWPVLQEGFNDF